MSTVLDILINKYIRVIYIHTDFVTTCGHLFWKMQHFEQTTRP
jgi:hypothetical protein